MEGSDFIGLLSIFVLFGMLGTTFVLVWIFGEDPNERYNEKRHHGSYR